MLQTQKKPTTMETIQRQPNEDETFKAALNQQYAEYLIEKNLGKAFEELFDGENKLTSIEKLFRKTTERKETNLRPDIEYPDGLIFARRLYQTGFDYLRELRKIAPSERNANIFERAILLSKIISARITAQASLGYIAYWKNCNAYNNFGVLGYQANAYAQLVCRNNWDFLVPLILLKPEEKLLPETAKDVERVFAYANASHAYALCLQAQIQCLQSTDQPSFPIIPEDPDENLPLDISNFIDKAKIMPIALPTISEEILKLNSQKAIRAAHLAFIGNEIKESICVRRETQGPVPKVRLAGFEKTRGGKAHRQRFAIGKSEKK